MILTTKFHTHDKNILCSHTSEYSSNQHKYANHLCRRANQSRLYQIDKTNRWFEHQPQALGRRSRTGTNHSKKEFETVVKLIMNDLSFMRDKIVFQVLMTGLFILIRWIWNQILKNIYVKKYQQ